ncbi:hypothetical protein FJT64_004439 [Amphibalanus amphitrite]|uniref:Uncharacterized protein n=1 Tax=Amphibalanus amphitrite TaxID=1232801 RepID=A0A6A4VZ59_AMPAM|nr:hypothetical protein FJT64_004439 [Amphibalanus amphitrite]
MKSIALQTDSATVHKWMSDALSGRARLRTKAHGASYEDMSPLTSYVSLLSAHLGSVSALQRSVVGHVLAEWAQRAAARFYLFSKEFWMW